jgi:hypothetical protein
MIFDSTNLFSDAQAITASGPSTNYIDLGATGVPYGQTTALVRDIGKGVRIPLRIQVVEAFNNLTSLGFSIEVDDNSSFSSPTVVETATINLAGLVVGAVVDAMREIPVGTNQRYARLAYTVTGVAPTTGKVTAGVVAAHQEQ